MKKSLILFLLIMILIIPLGAKASASFRFGAGAGIEMFFDNPITSAPYVRVEADTPFISLDEKNSISIPLIYEHSFRFHGNSRTQIIDSNKITIGIGYSYKMGENTSLGVNASGGLWMFDYSSLKMACTLIHSVEMVFSCQISEHLLLKTPVVFSSASFGNTISAAITFNYT